MTHQGQLNWGDQAFWAAPGSQDEAVLEALDEVELDQILLDGPRRCLLGERATLPLAVVNQASLVDNACYPLEAKGLLVAVRLESGAAHVGLSHPRRDSYVAEPLPDTSGMLDGSSTQVDTLEARARLELPWKAGTYLLRVLLHGRQSNSVRVELAEHPIDDPAVRAFLEAQRKPIYPAPIWPPLPREPLDPDAPLLPNPYRPDSASLPLPEGSGLVVETERVVLTSRGHTLPLRGSFRLPVASRHWVRPDPIAGDHEQAQAARAASGWREVGDPQATAIVPITLVLTGSVDAEPITLHLRVPSYDPVPLSAQDEPATLTGHFALDLRDLTSLLTRPQTYAVWALGGEHLSPCVKMALVTESMLPGSD